MKFPQRIENEILKILNYLYKREIRIFAIQSVSGGDINSAVKVISSIGNFFVKWNNADKYPQMFQKEAEGLKLLEGTHQLKSPQIIAADEIGEYSFLILEFIQTGKIHSKFWIQFGTSLAKIHQHTHEFFGLDHDNFIGSLPQSNNPHKEWISFFVEERLNTQLRLAYDTNLINKLVLRGFERLFKVLNEIFPEEPPALLHGDLWSGNFMIDFQGNPCLIDPAVYYGYREMDLAMSRLFGGFDPSFYEAYHECFPLDKGWEQRIEICNLYPLLVHANLFGGHYVSQVASILNKF